MKKYAFSLTVRQEFSQPISKHSFLLRCMPGTYPFQRSYAHQLTITPHAALTHIADVHGNEMYTGTIDKAHKQFSFTASGFVLSSKYIIHDPLDRLYLYPTALTRPSPALKDLLSAPLPEDPWERAKALCALTRDSLRPSEDPQVHAAAEVYSAGKGNAGDYAHVLLALCRLSGIGGRAVTGLAQGVPQAHTWVEVYCGGLWRALDPTRGLPAEEGYLKIAHGPDYDACALERSCFRDSGTDFARTVTASVTEHVIMTRDTVPHA